MNQQQIKQAVMSAFELPHDATVQVIPQENGRYRFLIQTKNFEYSQSYNIKILTMSHDNGLCTIVGEYVVTPFDVKDGYELNALKEALKRDFEIRAKPENGGLDAKYLISRGGKSYTLRELIQDIENETPFGIQLMVSMFKLTLNLLTRGKEELCEDFNIGRVRRLEKWEAKATRYDMGFVRSYYVVIEKNIIQGAWFVRAVSCDPTKLLANYIGNFLEEREDLTLEQGIGFYSRTKFATKEQAFDALEAWKQKGGE